MKFTLKGLQQELALILLGQASNTTISPPTNSPVEPGEKIIGVLEDPMVRMLYSFAERLRVYLEDYVSTVSQDIRPPDPTGPALFYFMKSYPQFLWNIVYHCGTKCYKIYAKWETVEDIIFHIKSPRYHANYSNGF
jgi:hypothetical protein